MKNLFSILITTFNDSENIDIFLSSLMCQTYQPNYIIVVDGGSKDDTITKIEKFKNKIMAKFIIKSGQRLNIAQGYNKAIQLCPTELMFLLGVGNTYPNDFIEKMFVCMEQQSAEIVYCPIKGNEITSFSKIFNTAFVAFKKQENGHDFKQASNRGVLIKKIVFKKIGLFYENFIYAGEDTEFFNRANKYSIKSGYANKTFLQWDTPASFKQYKIKCKVNAIADIQCFPWNMLFKNIISRILIILLFLLSFWTWYIWIIFFIFVTAIAVKTKSINPFVITLRFHFFFFPAYIYVKKWKLFNKKNIVFNKPIPKL